MNDQKKLNEKLQKENDRLNEERDSWAGPYKCNSCGNNVNYTFILKFIKESGLCPDCFNKEDEPKDLDKEKQILINRLESIQKEIDKSKK